MLGSAAPSRSPLLRVSLVAALVAATVVALASPAHAATFTVTTTVDDPSPDPSHCTDDDDETECSLREAVMAANDTEGRDTVVVPASDEPYQVECDSDFVLCHIEITDAVDIEGAGADEVTVLAANTDPNEGQLDQNRIFIVSEDVGVTFSGMTLDGGITDYGGSVLIWPGDPRPNGEIQAASSHSVVFDGMVVTGGSALIAGGGIAALNVVLTITDSTIDGNEAGFLGGGVFVQNGQLALESSTVSDNASYMQGGGVFVDGDASAPEGEVTPAVGIADSTISGNYLNEELEGFPFEESCYTNEAPAAHGVIVCDAPVDISGSVFSANGAADAARPDAVAGGLFVTYETDNPDNTLAIVDSRFTGNVAETGAGVEIRFAQAHLDSVTFDDNTNDVPPPQLNSIANLYYATVDVYSSTVGLVNSTIADNRSVASDTGDPVGAAALYAGIAIPEEGPSTVLLTNTTIVRNLGEYQVEIESDDTLIPFNTIIAEAPGEGQPNCGIEGEVPEDRVLSQGGNVSDDDTCLFDHDTDAQDQDPGVGALSDNGGPSLGDDGGVALLTAPLGQDSFATDFGQETWQDADAVTASESVPSGFETAAYATAPDVDERDAPRPVDAGNPDGGPFYDSGAYEFQPAPDEPTETPVEDDTEDTDVDDEEEELADTGSSASPALFLLALVLLAAGGALLRRVRVLTR